MEKYLSFLYSFELFNYIHRELKSLVCSGPHFRHYFRLSNSFSASDRVATLEET